MYTQNKFHIDEDPEGLRKKQFLKQLSHRFRSRKSKLIARFIKKTKGPKEGPNANIEPWVLYEGQFTKEQWMTFVEYVQSQEFQVYCPNLFVQLMESNFVQLMKLNFFVVHKQKESGDCRP